MIKESLVSLHFQCALCDDRPCSWLYISLDLGLHCSHLSKFMVGCLVHEEGSGLHPAACDLHVFVLAVLAVLRNRQDHPDCVMQVDRDGTDMGDDASSSSDDDDDDDAMDEDKPAPRPKAPPPAPVVDSDGFELVQGKGRRGGRR